MNILRTRLLAYTTNIVSTEVAGDDVINNYLQNHPLVIKLIPMQELPAGATLLVKEVSTQNTKSLFYVSAEVFGSMEKARDLILQGIELGHYYIESSQMLNSLEQLTFNHLLQDNNWIENSLNTQIFSQAKAVLKNTSLGEDPLYSAGQLFGRSISRWKIGLIPFLSNSQVLLMAKARNKMFNLITDIDIKKINSRTFNIIYTHHHPEVLQDNAICDWDRSLFKYFVSLMGKKNVHVVETECITKGFGRCVFTVTYDSEKIMSLLRKLVLDLLFPQLMDDYETLLRQEQLATHHWKTIVQEQTTKLMLLSTTDPLTMVKNRRYLDEELSKLSKTCHRNQATMSFIMIDIDHFKSVNDTYGHQFGDTCLQAVANLLQESVCREGDFVARYGGEEFAVVLPATDIAGAVTVAEHIRKKVETLHLPYQNTTVKLTISAGVSEGVAVEDITAKADKALYKAKVSGRNRVEQ